MKEYEYVLLACGGLASGDFSITFDTADQAYDYGDRLEEDKYVVSWIVKRVKTGEWIGKGPTDCIPLPASTS